MARGIDAPVHGTHVFRQAHVAANIQKFVANGLSLRPSTFNHDLREALFDFPAFQLVVASVCRTFGTDTMVTTRTAGIVVYALCLLALSGVLRRTAAPALVHSCCLFLFAIAPLNLFYDQAPMVDGLAVLLALLSLLGFVAWDEASRTRALPYVLMLVSGALATLIKNPVYLPVFAGILWYSYRRHGLRSLTSPSTGGFVLLVAASVVLFKLYSNWVNGADSFLGAAEADAYFGQPGYRLSPENWHPIGTTVSTLVLNPLTAAVGIAGVLLRWRRARSRWAPLYGGIFLGSLVTVLVFFNRHRWHNYYQLPFVFPLAYFAAYGCQQLAVFARAARRAGRRLAPFAVSCLLVVVAGVSVVFSWRGYHGLDSATGRWTAVSAQGRWIQSQAGPEDFVLYVVGRAHNWNPTFLYYAQRDGYNFPVDQLTREELSRLYARFSGRYRRLVVASRTDEAREQLERLGLPLLAASENGRLYHLAPSWIASGPGPQSTPPGS